MNKPLLLLFTLALPLLASAQILTKLHADSLVSEQYAVNVVYETLELKAGAPPAVLQKIDRVLKNAGLSKAHADSVFDTFVEFKKESMAGDNYYSGMGFSHETTVAKVNSQNGLFTVGIGVYEFAGGAHPNSWLVYYNFEISTGEQYGWREIVKPGGADSLTAHAERAFREAYEIEPYQALSSQGHYFHAISAEDYPFGEVKDGAFRLSDEFYLDGDDLVLYYNRYEIAPYVMPDTELRLPLSEVGQYLRLPKQY